MISIWKVSDSSLARGIVVLTELIVGIVQSVKCMNMQCEFVKEQHFCLHENIRTDFGAHPTSYTYTSALSLTPSLEMCEALPTIPQTFTQIYVLSSGEIVTCT
jgi:hypothetical protein